MLARVLGSDYYQMVLNDLLEWNVIVTDNHYIEGKESKGYDISMEYSSKAVQIMVLKEVFADKLDRMKHKSDSKPANYIKSQLKNILIRHQEALDYINKKYEDTITLIDSLPPDGLYGAFKVGIENHPDTDFYSISLKHEDKYDLFLLNIPENLKKVMLDKYNTDRVSIQNIMNREFCFTEDLKTGRVFTFVTNLSKSLRQFLYHRNHPHVPLVNIDIRNSQPFIFCSLLVDYYGTDIPKDVQEYISLCSRGRLYNELMDEMNYMGNRSAFKQMLFATLFYCSNGWADKSKESAYFRNRFPNVYAVIRHHKIASHKDLSRRMQFNEAHIIIGKVTKALMRNSVFLSTIHDSILTFDYNAGLVMDTITKYFIQEFNIIPSLDAEQVTESEFATCLDMAA
ncbi:hypothetical protein [Rufibacter sp. DG15C]|uniref:hypothetical protein n=1 Tax=Rufibacter sp. DG15C TaxID=1379909 RepID=UPI0012F72AB5|nr:hypothetical protein [Rufibacter sp. DG15C]